MHDTETADAVLVCKQHSLSLKSQASADFLRKYFTQIFTECQTQM